MFELISCLSLEKLTSESTSMHILLGSCLYPGFTMTGWTTPAVTRLRMTWQWRVRYSCDLYTAQNVNFPHDVLKDIAVMQRLGQNAIHLQECEWHLALSFTYHTYMKFSSFSSSARPWSSQEIIFRKSFSTRVL